MFDFLKIKDSIQSIQIRIDELRTEARVTDQKRQQVAGAPPTKAELREQAEAWLDETIAASGATIAAAMKANMDTLYLRDPQALNQPDVRGRAFGFLTVKPSTAVHAVRPAYGVPGFIDQQSEQPRGPVGIDALLFATFGPQFKKVVLASMDAMPWPTEGLPMTQRNEEESRLYTRSREVQKEIAELTQQAAATGLTLK